MARLSWFYRLCLRHKLPAVLSIVICPAVYFRNIAFPVAMARINRCCPFQGIGIPGVWRSYFPSFKNGIKEIEYKHQVYGKYNNGHNRDHLIQAIKFVE